MTEERKDEVEELFLLNKETDIDGIKSLEIQEIIFLIFSSRYFKQKQEFFNDNFDEKAKVIFDVLKDKIKNAADYYEQQHIPMRMKTIRS